MSADEQSKTIKEQTEGALKNIFDFDVNSLIREKELGSELSFAEVLPFAEKIINLYKQISIQILDDLPEQQLESLKNYANDDYKKFQQILEFSPKQPNPHQTRSELIAQMKSRHQQVFDKLINLISFSTGRRIDYERLEQDTSELIKSIQDKVGQLTDDLKIRKDEADEILNNIRAVAGEKGVTQQSVYFKELADEHDNLSEIWKKRTFWFAGLLGLYSLGSFFLHKISWIMPTDSNQSIQFAVSKVLIFTVISYILYLSAKNFLANKHNSIINRHRQTALMTYKAIMDAAKDIDKKEVILMYASSCIFSPQATGFSKDSSFQTPTAKSVIELLAKPFSGVSE